MRLLTLPRCAVKQCFELIKLEWFPGLFFEFPAMFDYFWYLHTGNRNPSLFPYQQGTILSAMNGCVCQHRLCFFIMFPCMNQSGAWKTQREDTVTPPQGCTEQNPQDAFSLWYGINHFLREACGKKKKKRCHVYWLIRYQSGKRVMKAATSATIQHQCQEAGARENERQTAEMNCRGLNVECDQC